MNQQSQNSQPLQRPYFQADIDDELSLIKFFKVLAKYKYLIIILTLLPTYGAYNYTQTLPTVYKATVLMISADGGSGNAGSSNRLGGFSEAIGSLMGNSVSTNNVSEQALVRFKTRSFLIDHIKEKSLKSVLFADQWNKSEKQWVDKEPSDRDSASLLMGMIEAGSHPGSKAGLMSLSVTIKNPVNLNKIADIANDLVSSMNFNAKQRAILEAENSIVFLEKELERTNFINAQLILYNLIEQQLGKIMMANVRNEFVFKVIDPAVTPRRAEAKPVLMIIFIGAALGIFFGSFIAISINYFKEQPRKITAESSI